MKISLSPRLAEIEEIEDVVEQKHIPWQGDGVVKNQRKDPQDLCDNLSKESLVDLLAEQQFQYP